MPGKTYKYYLVSPNTLQEFGLRAGRGCDTLKTLCEEQEAFNYSGGDRWNDIKGYLLKIKDTFLDLRDTYGVKFLSYIILSSGIQISLLEQLVKAKIVTYDTNKYSKYPILASNFDTLYNSYVAAIKFTEDVKGLREASEEYKGKTAIKNKTKLRVDFAKRVFEALGKSGSITNRINSVKAIENYKPMSINVTFPK